MHDNSDRDQWLYLHKQICSINIDTLNNINLHVQIEYLRDCIYWCILTYFATKTITLDNLGEYMNNNYYNYDNNDIVIYDVSLRTYSYDRFLLNNYAMKNNNIDKIKQIINSILHHDVDAYCSQDMEEYTRSKAFWSIF